MIAFYIEGFEFSPQGVWQAKALQEQDVGGRKGDYLLKTQGPESATAVIGDESHLGLLPLHGRDAKARGAISQTRASSKECSRKFCSGRCGIESRPDFFLWLDRKTAIIIINIIMIIIRRRTDHL